MTATASQQLLASAKFGGLPLVLMGASSGPDEVMKGIELGAVDFLEMPISPLKLRNIWQHVVRKVRRLGRLTNPLGKDKGMAARWDAHSISRRCRGPKHFTQLASLSSVQMMCAPLAVESGFKQEVFLDKVPKLPLLHLVSFLVSALIRVVCPHARASLDDRALVTGCMF